MPLGLYIHFPFCLCKCRYCDFCSIAGSTEALREAYVNRLCEEIESYRDGARLCADTVFFGGGTPSLLTGEQMGRILYTLRSVFDILPDAEITAEANPATLTDEKLAAYHATGINRISLGLQSIHENEQKILGRIHTSEDFYESMRMVRAHGFENVNVDIMYGIPGQTVESFFRTVDAVLAEKPTHISAYSLILEEGTPLYEARGELSFPDEDTELLMHEGLCERLRASGFSRYEISNFCLNGYTCRHNMKYWTMQPYIGFGAAAHSYFGPTRRANTSDLEAYIKGAAPEVLSVSPVDEAYEYAMLGLRTAMGISLADYKRRFGVSFTQGREQTLLKLAAMGYLVWDAERVFFTDRGLYVSNSLLTEIL